jgi:O-antigen/teichoic acid export membrane protein
VSAAPDSGVSVRVSVRDKLAPRAMSLGVANALDYALQFLLPVVLVRHLSPAAFGGYRLLWLATGTVMAVVTQAMAGSLYYFLPRSDADGKRLYINQAVLYLVAAGLVGAWAVSGLNPWLPADVRNLVGNDLLVPLFVLLWVVASLLDLIGTAEERVAWQTRTVVGLSALRALALSVTAILTRQLEPVLLALLGFAAFKLAVLIGYVARHHGVRGPFLRRGAFANQLRQSAPFGFAGALYGLRGQADQWVASVLFPVALFASFSIAALLGPLVHLCRQSVGQAFAPSLSRLEAAGDNRGMLALNSRGSVMVATLVYPLLAFAFVFSKEIVSVIYTPAYVDAVPVMRVYIIGLIALVIEPASIMLLLRQGGFSMSVGMLALPLSVAVSFAAAGVIGLCGAAAGSVAAIYFEHLVTLWRIARRTGIPLRRVQDWRSLALLLLCAALAGVVAWGVVSFLDERDSALRAVTGGVVLGAVYLGLVRLCGLGRDWWTALSRLWPGRLRPEAPR